MATGPNFYQIDFEREVVYQGKTTSFLTIRRNDSVMTSNEKLYVMVYPQINTFELETTIKAVGDGSSSYVTIPYGSEFYPGDGSLSFNNIAVGQKLKNFYTVSNDEVVVSGVELQYPSRDIKVSFTGANGNVPVAPSGTSTFYLGQYSQDSSQWFINGVNAKSMQDGMYSDSSVVDYSTLLANPFDGSTGGVTNSFGQSGTGFYSESFLGWATVAKVTGLDENNGVSYRIDYAGEQNGHLKLNFIVVKSSSNRTPYLPSMLGGSWDVNQTFGLKTGISLSDDIDFQEVHLFGYPESYVRTTQDINTYPLENPIYEDSTSYMLLKTNPKLSGNVKLTVDAFGSLWLNSFDANEELSDSRYKKFGISPNSTYQVDLHKFFKDGTTPPNQVFQLYQYDQLYYSTKRNLNEQYDNFYNYGGEQLSSKFYDEKFSFLAPIWLRKELPDYFVIFRVDGPVSSESYLNPSDIASRFNEFFTQARIVKTFDMRQESNLGKYLRKIVNDDRFVERPIEINYEEGNLTTWNGISYTDAAYCGKSELLSEFWQEDRPIIETEEYITSGFERNNVICANLINLEFLFDDEEADTYSINRYVGFYVKENQLAEFEIEPAVLSKITGQTPAPKPGVDGEPYSTRDFVQTNSSGVQLPVRYYHNASNTINTTNVPEYQGYVVGKFPLPVMVDDPMRIFYVKDRDGVLKRVNKLQEVDYGYPGNEEYRRVTQLQLFDNQENISKYGGINQIVSQVDADLLNSGDAQLVIDITDPNDGNILANGEELSIIPTNYEIEKILGTYYVQAFSVSGGFDYYVSDSEKTTYTTATYVQPSVGSAVSLSVSDSTSFNVGDIIYVFGAGVYRVSSLPSSVLISAVLVSSAGLSVGSTLPNTNTVISSRVISKSFSDAGVGQMFTLVNGIEVQISTAITNADAFEFTVSETNISISKYTPSTSGQIGVELNSYLNKQSWIMISNGSGLQPGDAWNYPSYDPSRDSYLNNFSNEGTAEQVASAIATCINNFGNCPVYAFASGTQVFMKSKLRNNEGNTIVFKRSMIKDMSYYSSIGFYEAGNVDYNTTVTAVDITGTTSNDDVTFTIKEDLLKYSDVSYFIRLDKRPSTSYVYVYVDVDLNSDPTATYNTQSYLLSSNILDVENLPFTLDVTNIADNTISYFACTVETSPSTIEQLFVGGTSRNRNRAKIGLESSKRYYQDRTSRYTVSITQGSYLINIGNTANVYVGAAVSGTGIPTGSRVVEVQSVNGNIVINKAITATATSTITVGAVSPTNSTENFTDWFQVQKNMYDRLEGWNVQNKYVYSLPYLDEPVFDEFGNVSSFTDSSSQSIIQLKNDKYEFYRSSDNFIVAYSVYRPAFGLLSVLPIKTFDFDFYTSDYSYTPTNEAFRYFFDETGNPGDTIELPLFENYLLTFYQDITSNEVAGSGSVYMQAYDSNTSKWVDIETLTFTTTDNGILLNTFYPLYTYDYTEYPYTVDNDSPQSKYPGIRNFNRRWLSRLTNDAIERIYPTKFRLKIDPSFSASVRVRKNDYENDKDVKSFNGFAGLQDILNQTDVSRIEKFRGEGDYLSAYTYQLLLSEYDRLRENFNKEYAVKSKVVPYINKWVLEGTDARDNYYRLNSSGAFGLSNMSPSTQISFVESQTLSQEFPYIDTVPKDYPETALQSSRSYQFSKLSDAVTGTNTWYDVLTSDTSVDWFTKYFTTGYPSVVSYDQSTKVFKPREERYTFFRYNNGLGRSETVFRGAKIQPVDLSTVQNGNIVETLPSSKFNSYKFAAIKRTEPYVPYSEQPPIEIEIVRNDEHRNIIMIVTERVQDYRIQSGLSDYMFDYAAKDLLVNSPRQQKSFDSAVGTSLLNRVGSAFFPYLSNTGGMTGLPSAGYQVQSTQRLMQGFYGGGYLRLADSRLGGNIRMNSRPPSLAGQQTVLSVTTTSDNYPFNATQEIYSTLNAYRFSSSTGGYFYQSSELNTIPSDFSKDGNILKLILASQDGQQRNNFEFASTLMAKDFILPDTLRVNTARSYRQNVSSTTLVSNTNGTNWRRLLVSGVNIPVTSKETYSLYGGTSFLSNIRNLLSFGSIADAINKSNVSYYVIQGGVKTVATDYSLEIIPEDTINMKNSLYFVIDEDKPIEYQGSPLIGFDIKSTNVRQYMIRHRGFYEPKTRDVILHWVREDDSASNHFAKDFLLSNTRIDNGSSASGQIKNYGINKVADSEILKIARSSSYRSLYPLVGEVSVDRKDAFVLDSTWDNNFYRKYSTTTSYQDLSGLSSMKEIKSFMVSKMMNTPNAYDVQTFNATEVTFVVDQPGIDVGVSQVQSNTAAAASSSQGQSKPKLTISLNLRDRLLRQIEEDITSGAYVDEFTDLLNLNIPEFNALSTSDINRLRSEYINTNIIPLYRVSSVKLYVKKGEGLPLVEIELTEAEKLAAGYRENKDFSLQALDNFTFKLVRIIDTKEGFSYSVGCTIERI